MCTDREGLESISVRASLTGKFLPFVFDGTAGSLGHAIERNFLYRPNGQVAATNAVVEELDSPAGCGAVP